MTTYAYKNNLPKMENGSWAHPSACLVGNVKLEAGVSVWCGAVVRADVNHIIVGEESNIQDLACLHVSRPSHANELGAPLLIGRRVTVGHQAMLHGCNIGDECLIGMSSIILDGAVLEPQVLLGAGSLVPPGKTLHSGWLYMGSPAKPIRRLSEEEIGYFSLSAKNYVELMKEYC